MDHTKPRCLVYIGGHVMAWVERTGVVPSTVGAWFDFVSFKRRDIDFIDFCDEIWTVRLKQWRLVQPAFFKHCNCTWCPIGGHQTGTQNRQGHTSYSSQQSLVLEAISVRNECHP